MDLILWQPLPYKAMETFMSAYTKHYYAQSRREKLTYLGPLFGFLLFQSAYYLVLTVYEPPSSAWKLVAHDAVRLTGLPVETNFVFALCFLQAAYYLWINYLQEHSSVASLTDLLYYQSSSLLISQVYYKNVKKLPVPVSVHIRRYCSYVLSLLQLFIICIGLSFFFIQYYGLRAAFNLPLPSSTRYYYLLLIIFSSEVNLALTYAAIYSFSYSLMLMAVLCFTILETIRVLLVQLEQLLDKLLLTLTIQRGKNKQNRKLTKQSRKEKAKIEAKKQSKEWNFRREYVRAVVNIGHTNEHIGSTLVPLLLVNCPANAQLAIALITSYYRPESERLDLKVQFFMIAVMMQQFVCIFLLHVLIARLNGRLKKIARSYAPLLFDHRVLAKGPQLEYGEFCESTKVALQGNLFYATFHTQKSYGFTYLTFGHCSMFAFVKYLLLHSELLMSVFQSEMKKV